MAIYHCSVQVIGRNAGRSSVAAAAYRAGEDLINEYDGIEHDFRKKNWVEYKEIILPEHAPLEYADRSTLWNAVELSEKSKDAQLCREFELSLPVELSRKQQIEAVERFVRDKLISQGMVVDIAIHNPPVMNDRHQPIDAFGNTTKDIRKMQFMNPHAHVIATMRPMDKQGRWMAKSKTEYLCMKDGEEKGFTAEEFKISKKEGWEKQYKFVDGKHTVWLTATEGQVRGLERVNRSPKTTPYGRKNEIIDYWNSKDRIFEWRQYWETVVNDQFISIESDIRIDCRSFKDQGRTDELPTLHMGTAATNMERRAAREILEGKPEASILHSDIANINKQIKEHNQFVRALKKSVNAMVVSAREFVDRIAKRLEGVRVKMIGNHYEESVLLQKLGDLSLELMPTEERLKKYHAEISMVQMANEKSAQVIRLLRKEIAACSLLQLRKRKQLQEQIQELQRQIEDREDYMSSIARMCGFTTEYDYQITKRNYENVNRGCQKIKSAIEQLQQDREKLANEYFAEIKEAQSDITDTLQNKCAEVREEMELFTKEKLKEKYGDEFREDTYEKAKYSTDQKLGKERNTVGDDMKATKSYREKKARKI